MRNTSVLFIILSNVLISGSLLARQDGLKPSVNSNWLDRIVPDPKANNLDLELEKADALVRLSEQKVKLATMVDELAQQNYLMGMASNLETKKAEIDLAEARVKLELSQKLREEIVDQQKNRTLDSKHPNKAVGEPIQEMILRNAGLQKSDLDDCSMHVVGIYSPQANKRDSTNEVFVTVKGLDKPSIIVLSAYNATFWRIRFEKPENIKLVIVMGYYAQRASIDGNSPKTPLIVSSYFKDTSTPTPNNPWGYATSWKSEQGWRLANMLYELTGRTASTFIGMDQARTITIDGKKGALSIRDAKEPISGLLTEQEIKDNPIPFETDEWNANRSPTDRENASLEDVEQSLKQLILETESKVKSSKSELDDLEKEIEELLRNLTNSTALDRSRAKTLFSKRFELQFVNQNLRGELAHLKLKLIASQQRKRLQNRDTIIEQEIDEALEKRKTQKSKE